MIEHGYYWVAITDWDGKDYVTIAEWLDGNWYETGYECSMDEAKVRIIQGPLTPPTE